MAPCALASTGGPAGNLAAVAHQTVDEILALLEAVRVEGLPPALHARASPEAYRSMSHDVLRQSHAHAAAERPTASAVYAQGDRAMYLWSRQGPDAAPWVALVTSVSRTRAGIVLNAGYRVVVESAEEAAALAGDPGRALATLLARYGVSFYTGRKRVYFAAEHRVELPARLETLGPDAFARAVGLETPPVGAKVAVNVVASPGEGGETLLSWFFVLDLTRYEQETRPRGR
jgi:hypothetical protein